MVNVKIISGNFYIGNKGGTLGKVFSLTEEEFERVKAQGHIDTCLEVIGEGIVEDNTVTDENTRLDELLSKDNLTKKETKELEALKKKLGYEEETEKVDETTESEDIVDPDLNVE